MVGALYGSVLTLDGVSSRSLGAGAAIALAFSTTSVVAAAGGLWGLGAGLAAGTLYAVAPIRMDPMYWHGLATALALVFVPLVVLALGLMFAGRRDPPTEVSGFGLVGVTAAHSTTAVVVAATVATAVLLDGVRAAFARTEGSEGFPDALVAARNRGSRGSGRRGSGSPRGRRRSARAASGGETRRSGRLSVLRAGLAQLARSRRVLHDRVPRARRTRRARPPRRRSSGDAALLAVASIVLGCIAVSQLWRLGIAYEYRRVVYPFGLALALLVGAAAARIGRWAIVAPVGLLACAVLAHQSVGFRLPQRLLSERVPTSTAPAELDALRGRIDRGDLPDARLVVADRCLHFIVPYLLERPTIAAFEDWQVAYRNRVPTARRARSVIAGGLAGRRVAADLHVGYVVADPRCTPTPAPGLGGTHRRPTERPSRAATTELSGRRRARPSGTQPRQAPATPRSATSRRSLRTTGSLTRGAPVPLALQLPVRLRGSPARRRARRAR